MPRDVKAHKVRDWTPQELETRIGELRQSLFNLRFRNSMKQLDNPLELRNVRREIAMLKTVLAEHEQGIRPLDKSGSKSED